MTSPKAASHFDYVQYGCGWSAPEGWLNFDSSPTLWFERLALLGSMYTRNRTRFPPNVRYGDIVKGLPVPEGACEAVYCSHVLEHLALEDCRTALLNTFRIIKPGGEFRLVMPDLEHLARDYLAERSVGSAPRFMQDSGLGRERRSRSLGQLLISAIGNSAHLWMWDFASLEAELIAAGFTGVRRAVLGDSGQAKFNEVENPQRWADCLGVHCRKPG